MVKNPSKKTEKSAEAGAVVPAAVVAPVVTEPRKIDLTKPAIKDVIDQGLALIKEGKSKADAARAIYAVIKDEPKEVIVAAFVAGATLTDKGALTYFYNSKRRAEKDAKKS